MNDVRREWYLFHYTPPADMGPSPILFLTSPDGGTRSVKLTELAAFKHPLVTHSFHFLVEWFRKLSISLPLNIIDIESAKKLIVGRPKSDFINEVLPWDMSAIMLPYLPAEYDNVEIKRALTTHLAEPRSKNFNDLKWIQIASKALPNVWHDLHRELSAAGEYKRYISVEVPAHQAMFGAQYVGIKVDNKKRDSFLKEAENKFISVHHSLAIKHQIHVERSLRDASYLTERIKLPNMQEMSPRDIIDLLRSSEPICSMLHDLISARRNKQILLRMFSFDQDVCHPVFDIMGTVTGRILAVDPHLQYLKKAYRSVLIPRQEKRHVYIDYSQFEPNIMASISCDSALLELCRTNDIYNELSTRILGNRKLRKQAKKFFLSYSYGMDREKLIDLIRVATGLKHSNASAILDDKFYKHFAGVHNWRESLHKKLANEGRIGTVLGNYRNRSNEGSLNSKEERWSVSQVVQGTGSLILKRLICKIFTHLPEAQILLPMHDALLIEIPASDAAAIKDKIVEEFISTFNETCPGVVPQVTVGPFGEEDKRPSSI
jgi:DNA polymerase-1